MHRIHDLQAVEKIISVCWVIAHVGIEGNELADTAAKSASERPEKLIIQIAEVLLGMHWLRGGYSDGKRAGIN